MFLTFSGNKKAGDVLLDTSLSFEARSLYLLIDSLGGQQGELYTPSITILVATTGWSKETVQHCLAELVARNLARELTAHSGRFHILPFTSSVSSSVFADSPTRAHRAASGSVLTDAERDALLKSLH